MWIVNIISLLASSFGSESKFRSVRVMASQAVNNNRDDKQIFVAGDSS